MSAAGTATTVRRRPVHDSPITPVQLPRSLQSRVAAWADSRLLPVLIVLLLCLDVGMATNWLLSPPANLAAPAYAVAKQLAPMDVHGGIFGVAAVAAALAVAGLGRAWLAGWLLGGVLASLWLFWAVCFALAPIGMQGASYAGAVFAVPLCLLHLLAGLALTHRPESAAGRRRD